MGSECDLGGFEQVVLETLKRCQQQNESTLVWVMEVAKCIRSLGVGLPCLELGHVLVSQLCFDDNNSSLWKFVELALSSGLLYPLHVLSLLTSRSSIPHFPSTPSLPLFFLSCSTSIYLFVISGYFLIVGLNQRRIDSILNFLVDMHFHLIQKRRMPAKRSKFLNIRYFITV